MRQKILRDFEIQTDHPNQVIRARFCFNKNKQTFQLLDQAITEDHKGKLWNLKVTVMTIIAGALGKIPTNPERRMASLEIRIQI